MTNYIFENEIKISILTNYQLSYQQVAQAVVDLKAEISKWLDPFFYTDEIGAGPDSCEKHLDQLLPLINSIADLINLLTEHSDENYVPKYADNARNSLVASLRALVNFNGNDNDDTYDDNEGVRPFLQQLRILCKLASDLRSQWPNIMPVPEGDYLFDSFEDRLMRFKRNPKVRAELLVHPVLSWCDKELSGIKALRESIRGYIKDFRALFELDERLGLSDHQNARNLPLGTLQNSFVKFHEYYSQNGSAPSWFHWGIELTHEMEKCDPQDLTGWQKTLKKSDGNQTIDLLGIELPKESHFLFLESVNTEEILKKT